MSKSAGLMLPKLTYCFHKSFLFTNLSFPGLKTYSNWPTYPQLYVDGELIGGLDILKEMHSTGDLEAVLPKKQARTMARMSTAYRKASRKCCPRIAYG